MASAPETKPAMPRAVLGRSGLIVSRLSYGAWVSFSYQLDVDKSVAANVDAASAQAEAETAGAYQLMVHAYKGIVFFIPITK